MKWLAMWLAYAITVLAGWSNNLTLALERLARRLTRYGLS